MTGSAIVRPSRRPSQLPLRLQTLPRLIVVATTARALSSSLGISYKQLQWRFINLFGYLPDKIRAGRSDACAL